MKFVKVAVVILCCFIRGSTSQEWQFPDYFKFGTATSAYQIEGGWDADGKGLSVWDRLAHSGIAIDNSTGDIACDSYNKWRDDVEMLKELNVNYYRFSLSWTRILPNGFANVVNPAGEAYYNELIDALIEANIEPVVTLFHWDTPEIFTAMGGFHSSNFVDLYTNYAEKAFSLFGDRVKTWITFNEPKVFCQDYSDFAGSINQVYPNGFIEYMCSHNIIQAHVKAYHLYDTKFRPEQQGKVGITLNFEWSEPASDSSDDHNFAERRRQFEFGLYANPIVYGDYPQVVVDRVASRSRQEGYPESRLPKFTLTQKLNNRGTFDFLGLNHYNTRLITATEEHPIGKPNVQADIGGSTSHNESWPDTEWEGKVAPFGIRSSLRWIKETYGNPEIIITECGYPDRSGTLEDVRRINFLQEYLNATLEALILDEVNVRAFTVWSLMDNFEWGQGYTIKFGLYQVNFDDPSRPRVRKNSADYFTSVIQTRTP